MRASKVMTALLVVLWLCVPAVSNAQWVKLADPGGNHEVLAADVQGTDIIAATTSGTFRSTDGGATWVERDAGLDGGTTYCLARCGSALFAGTENGVFRSTDEGEHWSALNAGLMLGSWYRTLFVEDTLVYAGSHNGLFRISVTGDTWTDVNPYVRGGMDQFSNATLAGQYIFVGTNLGIYRSADHGGSWTSVNEGLTNTDIWFVGGTGSATFVATPGSGVFRSTDFGDSWERVSDGGATWLRAMTSDASVMMAANLTTVVASIDGGLTWTIVGPNTTMYSVTISGSYAYASSGSGLYKRAVDNILCCSGLTGGVVCCSGHTGNVDMRGVTDLSDLSALVSYLTGGGYTFTCYDAANVNATGVIDVSDLTALVSYLTGGGYTLPACP